MIVPPGIPVLPKRFAISGAVRDGSEQPMAGAFSVANTLVQSFPGVATTRG